jgi:hypothetical protein
VFAKGGNLMNIKGSVIIRENRAWKSNLQYKVLFLDDRLLFLKTGSQASWEYLIGVVGIVAFIVSGQLFTQLPDLPVPAVIALIIGLALVVLSYLLVKNKNKGIDEQIELSNTLPEAITYKIPGSFSIPYKDILTIEVQPSSAGMYGFRKGTLFVRTMKYFKFDIVDPQPIEQVQKLALSITH